MAPKLESGAPVRKRRSRFMPQFMVTAAVLQALVTIAGAFVGGRGLLRMDIFLTVRTMDKRSLIIDAIKISSYLLYAGYSVWDYHGKLEDPGLMQFSLFIPAIGGAIYSGAWSLEDGAPDNFWPMRSSMRFVLGALSTVGMTIVFERIRSTWRKWRKAGRDMESFETQVTQATQDLKLESMSRGYD